MVENSIWRALIQAWTNSIQILRREDLDSVELSTDMYAAGHIGSLLPQCWNCCWHLKGLQFPARIAPSLDESGTKIGGDSHLGVCLVLTSVN